MDERVSVELIQAFTDLWSAIRRNHSDVPSVVLLAAPSPHKSRNVLGHFGAVRWWPRGHKGQPFHEVLIVAEHLDRSIVEIAGTVFHEAAHAMNYARGRRDCSASQYHNSWFKEAAEELGLTVYQVAHYGFAHTQLTAETVSWYDDELAALEAALIYRLAPREQRVPAGPPTDAEGDEASSADKAKSRNVKATCKCGFIIRTSRKTMKETTITCGACMEIFASS